MTHRAGSRRGSGFTLLEVLAAVAILGVWYTVLASLAIQGLRAEGESARRLRASLLADEVLADLEVGVASGLAPAVGSDEEERDDFTVRVEITPYEFSLPEPEPNDRSTAQSIGDSLENSLLAASGNALREITVEVSWLEGANELLVTRNSYALDLATARDLLREVGLADNDQLLADEAVNLDEISQ